MLRLRNTFKIKHTQWAIKKQITLAMLMAIAVVLGYYTLTIGEFIKIGFSNIPVQFVAYLFGPVTGGIFGGTADILKYIVRPTGAFFPGFTISGILNGIIAGLFLYKKPITLVRVVSLKLFCGVFIEILLNTYWLSILYGSEFMVLLPVRMIKTSLMTLFEIIIIMILFEKFKKIYEKTQ